MLTFKADKTGRWPTIEDGYLRSLTAGRLHHQALRCQRIAGTEVHLTPIEYRLLGELVANAGRVTTHRHVLREVWGPSHFESTLYLRVYVNNLLAAS